MKPVVGLLLGTFLCHVILWPSPAHGQSSRPPAIGAPEQPAGVERWVEFRTGYRLFNTTDYPGRVGEYDGLFNSVGGDLSLRLIDHSRNSSFEYRGSIMSRNEFDLDSRLRLGKYFSLGVDARSLVRHLDKAGFGRNLSPDDIVRTDPIPDGTFANIKKRMLALKAVFKVPGAPVTFFAKGGSQTRQGLSEVRYFDMGADSSCGSCHQATGWRSVHNNTHNAGAGVEARLGPFALSYEHHYVKFDNQAATPVDFYGTTHAIPDDALPPGVDSTMQGFYPHNLLPSNHTHSDAVRLRAIAGPDLVMSGGLTYGRRIDEHADNHQNFLNGDATVLWHPRKRVRTTLEYRQQNVLNDFTPPYPLYGNVSLHRYRTGAKVGYRLAEATDLEVYYRRANTTRSNAGLWPQVYSPNNQDLLRVVGATFSNTLGATLSLHGRDIWTLRAGYEFVGTHAPGYLTEPGAAHRISARGSISPHPWLHLTEDFQVTMERDFPIIERQNRQYASTSYLTLKPVPQWSLGLGYAYLRNNLGTDLAWGPVTLTSGTDSLVQESLVPFRAWSQNFTLSSIYAFREKVQWNVDLERVLARSEFQTGLASDKLGVRDIVTWAGDFSRMDASQTLLRSDLVYHWAAGLDASFRLQIARYDEVVRPELTGSLRSFAFFLGRRW
jgi:hypothetical protein